MPSPSSQSRIDRNTYIPPHVQQAMTQHAQQNMPAHLKKYVGTNAAYVPQHMQAQVAQQMQKNMPGHLKQYAGAYMQQQVVQPNTTRLHGSAGPGGSRQTFMPPPAPDPLRRGHSMPVGEQHTVELNTLPNDTSMFQSDYQQTGQEPQQPNQYQQPPQEPQHVTAEQAFDFIMNPDTSPKKPMFSGDSSLIKKVAFGGGALLALMIIFVVAKSFLGGSGISPSFLSIAQDQQQIIHLTTAASQRQDLTTANNNFTATAQVSITTSQNELLKYMSINKLKIKPKQLQTAFSPQIDSQLTAAGSATTFNQTYREVMKTQLNKYMNQLKATYQETDGNKGKALLNNDFEQAQLLLLQLEDTKS